MRTRLVFPFLILSLLFIPVCHTEILFEGRKVFGFKLALQWPKSYCNQGENCKLPIPQQFKIHGFWPTDFYGHVMTTEGKSGKDGLKSEDVADMKNDLDEIWPKLRGNNFDFWAEEWRKHGCSDPHSYFKLAIQCKRKLDDIIGEDLVDYLSGKGFGPNASTDHANQQFPIKIKKKTNSIVEIKCNTADGKSQLLEIYICFKTKGDFANCNENPKRKGSFLAHYCEKRIIFPIPIKKEPHDEL